ncbi:MAG TPA: proton-conducting transporter membrane subunit [Nocardioidaceae bacterium]|nr:proton-conducting transporter membrane subunit [Nocardioidaceae bacterium]
MHALVPLPVIVPLAAAVVIAGFGKFVHSRLVDLGAILVALADAVITVMLLLASLGHSLTYWYGGWQPVHGLTIGIAFVVQPFGAALAVLASLGTLATLIFSYRYFEEVGALFHMLVLVFLGAMCGFAMTGDLFNLFVFFELMSVTAFALTAYRSDEAAPLQGAVNFTVVNTVAAILILFGMGLLYGRTDALNMAAIGRQLAHVGADPLLVMAFALITCGYLVKAAVVPFHFWLADAYAAAPAPAAVLFAAVMSDLGLYAVAEIYWTIFDGPFGQHANLIRGVLLTLGMLTAMLGAVMSVLQRKLKRLLAFATISHIGLFLLGIGLLDNVGLAGAIVYLCADGLVKGGLFLGAGVLAYRLGSGDEFDLRGRGSGLPVLGTTMALGGLALATLPPFGTFVGKGLIEDAAAEAGAWWLPWTLLFAEVLTGGAVLRATGRIFLGLGAAADPELSEPQDDEDEDDEPENPPGRSATLMTFPVVLLVVGGLLVGFIPHVADRAADAAVRFVARPTLLDHTAAQSPHLSTAAYLFGAGACAGALAFAFLSLTRIRRVSAARDRGAEWLRLPVSVLHGLHSGHVGDYVTWLVVGVTSVGAACLLGMTHVVP